MEGGRESAVAPDLRDRSEKQLEPAFSQDEANAQECCAAQQHRSGFSGSGRRQRSSGESIDTRTSVRHQEVIKIESQWR